MKKLFAVSIDEDLIDEFRDVVPKGARSHVVDELLRWYLKKLADIANDPMFE